MNPDHLAVVTHRENVLRSEVAVTAINARKTHCINGHELTSDNIVQQSEKAGGGRGCRKCAYDRRAKTFEKHRDEYLERQREYDRKRYADPAFRERKNAYKRELRARKKQEAS